MERTSAHQIVLWADMLRDIAANGGRFASNVYDRDNYERITTIAMEMMAMVTAVREGWEETGVRSEPVGLVGIFDSTNHNSPGPHQLYQIVFLCRPLNHDQPDPPHHPQETLAKGWFSQHNLPQNLDPNHTLRIPRAFDFLKSREGYFE